MTQLTKHKWFELKELIIYESSVWYIAKKCLEDKGGQMIWILNTVYKLSIASFKLDDSG